MKHWLLVSIVLIVIIYIDHNAASPTPQPTPEPTIRPTLPPTIIPSKTPSYHPTNDPTEHPTINPTYTPTIATATPTNVPPNVNITQCFIGSKCKKAKDCCPDTMDEIYKNGIECSIKKTINIDKNTNDKQWIHNKEKIISYCCVENGYFGCSFNDDCCNEKSVCFAGVCMNDKPHKNYISYALHRDRNQSKNGISSVMGNNIEDNITVGQILIVIFGISFLSAVIAMYVYAVRAKRDNSQYQIK
eukprot:84661_1